MAAKRCRWESVWVKLAGNRIHLRRAGSGPPLLFLHGYPESSLTWRHLFDALHERFTCIAPDLAGWGRSEGRGSLTVARLLADARDLIQVLGLDRPLVVGHDWGAAVAFGLGVYHPRAVRRIVTINFTPGRFQLTRPLHFYFFGLPLLPNLILRLWPARVAHLMLRWWAARPEAFPPEVLRSYLRDAREPKGRRATLAYYRDLVRKALLFRPPLDLGPTGRRLEPRVPWDVIWGMEDPVATPKVLALLKKEHPSVRVFRIPGAGHFPHEENPSAFLDAFERILASDAAYAMRLTPREPPRPEAGA